MKLSVIFIIVALIIGVVGGYGTGYLIYEPKIRGYEVQVSALVSKVSELEQTVSSQEGQISTLQSEKSSLQVDLSSAQADLDRTQANLSRAQGEVTRYKEQLSTLNSEVSGLKERLNNILDITVPQHYEWVYSWQTWKWDLPITLSLYVEYSERPRPLLGASYVDMAKDPQDDLYIDQLIQKINSVASKKGFTEAQKLNFVIAFAQNLPYTVDIETTPSDEYPRYPIETLFDRGGDCEDTSILVAAILDRMGYDVALLHLKNAQHMAVGVSLPGTYGSYYEYDGKKYFYLETTNVGWQIGQIPPSFTDRRAYVYPLRS